MGFGRGKSGSGFRGSGFGKKVKGVIARSESSSDEAISKLSCRTRHFRLLRSLRSLAMTSPKLQLLRHHIKPFIYLPQCKRLFLEGDSVLEDGCMVFADEGTCEYILCFAR